MDPHCDIHALEADVVVQEDSSVVLVRPRTPSDGAEGWRLPTDMLRFGEAPETGARRILRDRLGLEPEWVVLAEVESSVDGGVWSLVFHFQCDADRRPAPGPAIAEARFFQIEHLPPTAHGTRERDVIYRVITAAG
ncbi:MAG: NUDIX domain-containing protein [Bacillati bacterium ANGP1]|uniref:NUDIX domain-containing protein n=1 Tax=Candidatus Segetimicrobium genomatis TaxID=2569760 RepID=A0A537L1G2_9BACT|nr:MAG: NUDIX domain-containing protein [Terrabacteria group bacterium ANGP1]